MSPSPQQQFLQTFSPTHLHTLTSLPVNYSQQQQLKPSSSPRRNDNNNNNSTSNHPNGLSSSRNLEDKWVFDAVLQGRASQQELYEQAALPLVKHVLKGTFLFFLLLFSCFSFCCVGSHLDPFSLSVPFCSVLLFLAGNHASIFSYGLTGSGKSHSIFGGSTETSKGMLARACDSLFNVCSFSFSLISVLTLTLSLSLLTLCPLPFSSYQEIADHKLNLVVYVTVFEIYLDKVRDLGK
jgi:hypothetical protein